KIFTGNAILLPLLVCVLGCTNEASQSNPSAPVSSNIKIGGSSETYGLLEMLTNEYQSEVEDVSFDFLPPSQTSGGIQGVKSDVIDIGGVSSTTAQDIDELRYIPLAQTPLVVVVHNSVTGVTNISSEQIKAIYSGQIENWKMLGGPDADIVIFDFTEDENEKQVLRDAYLGQDLAISSKAIVFAEDDELLETAAITEFSIAAVPYENDLDDLPLTILSIEEIFPSQQTIQSGQYVMTLPLGVVIDKEPSAEIEAFLTFASSDKGQKVLIEKNYIPAALK
ncbi:MAG: substrate-binding domain-containing protein, partial [Cyanobacteria bacterium P01_C01_bin.72]